MEYIIVILFFAIVAIFIYYYEKSYRNEYSHEFDKIMEQHDNIMKTDRGMQFEILPQPIQYNLFRKEKERMIQEAMNKTFLTQVEKNNFHKQIKKVKELLLKYEGCPADREPPCARLAIFTAGWYCEPLKKYAIEQGYKIYSCGNKLDLWIDITEK